MKPPRAGSRKASVFDAYCSRGVQDATDLGDTLQLAPSTVQSWISTWTRDVGKPHAPVGKRVASVSPMLSFKEPDAEFEVGDPVYDLGNPLRLGSIVKVGAEVSEVRWNDTRDRQYVTHNYLRHQQPEGEDVKTKARQRSRY